MNKEIGIIGVGLVGTVVADRLAAVGCSLCGFDVAGVDHPQVEALTSASAVFERCEIIILSLPNSTIVREVLAQVEIGRSHVVVDTTTGKPEDAIDQAGVLTEAGGCYLEATIAGSSDLLSKGKAPVFLGGESTALSRAAFVLSALAPDRFHVGAVGMASRFKLMFNLVLGLNRAVLAEALAFGESQGIAAADALEVLRNSPAFSAVMETKGGRMVTREYDPPQARLSQHLKDVRIMLESGAKLPLSEAHRSLLESAEALGFGDSDTSAVREAY